MITQELFPLPEKIKYHREQNKWTQAELGRRFNVTRSTINSWEMGICNPSLHFIVELAKCFHVSTDYLLGVDETATISVQGLTDSQVAAVRQNIDCFRSSHKDLPESK